MSEVNKAAANKNVANSMFDTSNLRAPKSELGKDDFLKLLVAQMANQDPMNTMSDTEFIAQMAQFSALEAMQALNTSFEASQAQNMIGKHVSVTTFVQNETTKEYEKVDLYGTVTGTIVHEGKTFIQVGDYFIDPADVKAVYDNNDYEQGIINGASMIGKHAYAKLPTESKENPYEEVNGVVDEIIMEKGHYYAKIGDKKVPISNISIVSDKPITPPKPKE